MLTRTREGRQILRSFIRPRGRTCRLAALYLDAQSGRAVIRSLYCILLTASGDRTKVHCPVTVWGPPDTAAKDGEKDVASNVSTRGPHCACALPPQTPDLSA